MDRRASAAMSPMIVFDGVHLACDGVDLEALHRFAHRIGMPRVAFQPHPRHPHYDILRPEVAARILARGAAVISMRLMAKLALAGRLAPHAPVVRSLTPAEEVELRQDAHVAEISSNTTDHTRLPFNTTEPK